MVAERCHDRYERNFGSGVYPEICIDLVQLGVVMFKNTQAQSYGLICGEGLRMTHSKGRYNLENKNILNYLLWFGKKYFRESKSGRLW